MRTDYPPVCLTFGVIGDLHLRGAEDEEPVRRALAVLRAQGVDAVVVTGDLAEAVSGTDRFRPFARAWDAVFPAGCGVERMVVLGERDQAGGAVAEAWFAAFGEAYAPQQTREVKGIRFVLCREPSAGLDDLSGAVRDQRVVFVVRHLPLTEHDGRIPPNVVALTGHTCRPLTDERTIRPCNGGMTADASSLFHLRASGGRENALAPDLPSEAAVWRHMPDIAREASKSWHGLVVQTRGNGLVFRRLDLVTGRSLCTDVAVPLGAEGVAALVRREAEWPAPQFPEGAEALVTERSGTTMSGAVERQVSVCFPAAQTPTRAFDYAVTVRYAEADLVKTAVEKRVYSYGLFRPEDDAAIECVFGVGELPWDVALDFEIVPRSAFGGAGAPLLAYGYVESSAAREKRLKKERKAALEKLAPQGGSEGKGARP